MENASARKMYLTRVEYVAGGLLGHFCADVTQTSPHCWYINEWHNSHAQQSLEFWKTLADAAQIDKFGHTGVFPITVEVFFDAETSEPEVMVVKDRIARVSTNRQ